MSPSRSVLNGRFRIGLDGSRGRGYIDRPALNHESSASSMLSNQPRSKPRRGGGGGGGGGEQHITQCCNSRCPLIRVPGPAVSHARETTSSGAPQSC